MPRIALIGVGAWGANYIGPLLRLDALRAIVDTGQDTLGAVAVPGHVARYVTLDDLLADGLPLDGVVIATAAPTHHSLASRALSAGLGVHVEKPVARTYAEAAELYRLAEHEAVTVMSGHLLLHHRGLDRMWRESRTGGLLSPLRYIRSTRIGHGRIRRDEDVMWSFAPHDLSAVLVLMGRMPATVRARKYRLRGTAVADLATIDLDFPSLQAHASIHVSWLGPEREHRLLAYAEHGTGRFDDGASDSDGAAVYRVLPDDPGRIPAAPDASVVATPPTRTRPLDREVELFCRCVAARITPPQDRCVTLAVMTLLEAADASSLTETEVAIVPNPDIDSSLFVPSSVWEEHLPALAPLNDANAVDAT